MPKRSSPATAPNSFKDVAVLETKADVVVDSSAKRLAALPELSEAVFTALAKLPYSEDMSDSSAFNVLI